MVINLNVAHDLVKKQIPKDNIEAAIEAILFASGSPVSISKLSQALDYNQKTIVAASKRLEERLKSSESGIMLLRLEDKYQLCTKDKFADAIRTAINIKKRTALSQASMEVIAIIAYNQPVTKAFVEQIRGVDCSRIISNLIEKDLIEEKGRLELPGKPLVYATTDNFLKCFQLNDLSQLPSINN